LPSSVVSPFLTKFLDVKSVLLKTVAPVDKHNSLLYIERFGKQNKLLARHS